MTPTEKIVFIRKQMGYSQEEFALKIRRSLNLIKNIESGRTAPKPDLIQSISDFTHIPAHDIRMGKVSSNSIKFTKETEEEFLKSQEADAGITNAVYVASDSERIKELKEALDDKNEIIAMLKESVNELKSKLKKYETDPSLHVSR